MEIFPFVTCAFRDAALRKEGYHLRQEGLLIVQVRRTFRLCRTMESVMSNLIAKLADGLIGRFENWRARERAYLELSSLDDRSLADIGLSRGDIPFVLAGSRAQQPLFQALNSNERTRDAA